MQFLCPAQFEKCSAFTSIIIFHLVQEVGCSFVIYYYKYVFQFLCSLKTPNFKKFLLEGYSLLRAKYLMTNTSCYKSPVISFSQFTVHTFFREKLLIEATYCGAERAAAGLSTTVIMSNSTARTLLL